MSRKQDKFIRDILTESMSKDHVGVIGKLDKPRYDEDVAEKLRLKATIVRTILNELHANGLVEYERSKNKKTGWYTYLWKRRDDKIKEHIQKYLTIKLDDLNRRLDSEKQGMSFICSCGQIPFEVAMGYNFACPKCEGSYREFDNSGSIDEIVTNIAEINSLLEQLRG